MDANKFVEADEVIEWLAEQARSLPAEQKSVEMAFALELTRLYLVEYAVHLHRGDAPADALLKTINGELEIKPETLEAHRRRLH